MTDFAGEVPADREDDVTSFDAPADETRAVPVDRADAPVSEVTERFLRAVIATVPLDRIEELHLFAPLRQGGIETGIAVVAARAPLLVAGAAPASLDDAIASPVEGATDGAVEIATDGAVEIATDGATEGAVEGAIEGATDGAVERATEGASDGAVKGAIEGDAAEQPEPSDAEGSPYADESISETNTPMSTEPTALDDGVSDPVASASDDLPAAPRIRHTVYTARYRLVLKGPERGRWEADVVDEADAPLLTVETVVRGVQRRAGEETEILRYSERQIARALRMQWPVITDVPAA